MTQAAGSAETKSKESMILDLRYFRWVSEGAGGQLSRQGI